jgi:hypothetical protein
MGERPNPNDLSADWEKHSRQRQHKLDYHLKYNEEHKDVLKEKKKNKYQTDPEYKAAALKRAKDRYLQNRQIITAIRKSSGIQPAVARNRGHSNRKKYCPLCLQVIPQPPKPTFKSVQKKYLVAMYTVREVARRLGKQVPTVLKWIREGDVIPDAMYKEKRTGTGMTRLWTQDQVEMLMRVFDKYDLRPPVNFKTIGLVKELRAEWDRLRPLGIDVKLYAVKDEDSGLLARSSYELPLPSFASQSEKKEFLRSQRARLLKENEEEAAIG